MRVLLIAQTELSWVNDDGPAAYEFLSKQNGGLRWNEDGTVDPESFGCSDGEHLIEFAGRACYQSWDRPNPKTSSNEDYIKNIINSQHFSVLEHASATFYIQGVSRSLTHELIRHRHLSFSQLSQRFVDESDAEFVTPPALAEVMEPFYGTDVEEDLGSVFYSSVGCYNRLVELLLAKGLSRKQAREAARSVLPNAAETKIVVTGNFRAWREFISKRATPHADAEIRALALEILRQLKELAPSVFFDYTTMGL